MNRRSFGKYIGVAALMPTVLKPKETLADLKILQEGISETHTSIPDVIAGRLLSEEEKLWMTEFFKNFDKSMADIRSMDLPHDLIPAFIPKYPPKKSKRKLEATEE